MPSRFLQKLKVDNDQVVGYVTDRWINPDIAPLPPNRRTWGYWAYIGWGSIARYAALGTSGGMPIDTIQPVHLSMDCRSVSVVSGSYSPTNHRAYDSSSSSHGSSRDW